MAAPKTLLHGTAFITGAGSGIGQYAALAFAQNGVKQFALTDIKPENLQATIKKLKDQSSDVEIEAIEMDVAVEEQVKSAIEKTVKRFGKIDHALNNAGIGGPIKASAEMDTDGWTRCIDINLHGVFFCQRALIQQMLKQESAGKREGRGTIVNVASMYGLVGCSPSLPTAAYIASKHAVVGLTKNDGIIYAPKNIRINAICPGYVATPLLLASTSKGEMDLEIKKVPMGRLADMEEIADAIVFLSSPMSSFMCGAQLVVDGGYTAQ